MRHDVNVEVKY